MRYIALLRGINVGGNCRVEMKKLTSTFERMGYTQVQTYINSGNVVFGPKVKSDNTKSADTPDSYQQEIEREIEKDFGFAVSTYVVSASRLTQILSHIPHDWKNDDTEKTDVCFLWPEVDREDIMDQVGYDPNLETMIYVPGVLIWHVSRENQNKSKFTRIVGTKLYKAMTVRNINTVRKLAGMIG